MNVLKADIITNKQANRHWFGSTSSKDAFLWDVFQMTAIALITHLNSSSEVVNHPDALFIFLVWHEFSDWSPL